MLTKRQLKRILSSMDTLGTVMRKWREAAGLGQSEAARHCGISPQHWWALENDKRPNPDEDTKVKLSEGMGIDYARIEIACAYSRMAKSGRVPAVATPG